MPLATALLCLSTAHIFEGSFSIIPSEKGSLCFTNEFPREYVRIGSLLALVLPNATKSFFSLMESKLIYFLNNFFSSDAVPLTGLLLYGAVEVSFSLNEKLMHIAEERKLVVDDLLGMPYSNGVVSEEGKHQEY